MADGKQSRPKARTVRGFRDRAAGELAAERTMLDAIRRTFESYGFDALETPLVEYTDALGKFLPDVDRPNAGVFSFRDDDEQWVSLRYDLTAPLARYVAENQQFLPRPFRRYQIGTVFRNDKPGPGRFREFIQCDADTVGTASPAADAEMVMMFADTLEALGLKRGEYVIKVSSRKLLDALLDSAGISSDPNERGAVFRALDKLDRLGPDGVRELLGSGRQDQSGDFTVGAKLQPTEITRIMAFVNVAIQRPFKKFVPEDNQRIRSLQMWRSSIGNTEFGQKALDELALIESLITDCGYDDERVQFDGSIIRGLDYYTSTVFEAQLRLRTQNEKGQDVVFGSVGGGGRYDDLVARFTNQRSPAVGFSIGVSRLSSALQTRRKAKSKTRPLVVVAVMDPSDPVEVECSFRLVRELKKARIRAEAYVGTGRMDAQFKYADKRGAQIVLVQGSDERIEKVVTIKDLIKGSEIAKSVQSREEWVGNREAQFKIKRDELLAYLKSKLAPKR